MITKPTLFALCTALLLTAVARGATINARSANYNDVKAAYDSAANGDTINVPAGTVTWGNGLFVNKAVTIQGAGAQSTIINKSAQFYCFEITAPPIDQLVRITGFRINAPLGQKGKDGAAYCKGPQHYPGNTKIRIDHCYFHGGQQVILWEYEIIGCIDHCTFQNCIYNVQVYGMGNIDWDRYSAPNPAFQLGSLDAVFVEDCLMIWDADMPYAETMSDGFVGGRNTWRHNVFDASTQPESNAFLIQHGNENLWNGGTDWLRGPISFECYDNEFKINSCYRVIWIRGGRFLVANNKFTVANGSIGKMVCYSEEEAWTSKGPDGTGWFPSVRATSAWPAEDMANGFVFGNTVNGKPQDDSMISGWDGNDSIIQKDRDWFNHPPNEASGKIHYPNAPSPSNSKYPNPYNPVMSSWTPAPYPHPLVSGGGGPAPSPTPTPSATPSPSPSPSVTPSPTPAPTPSATPTPAPSPTATPTPTPPGGSPNTFFDCSDKPNKSSGDSEPVELGMQFVSDIDGEVVAIRFWKDPGSTSSHTGNLWDEEGKLLGSASFKCETASGWQTAILSQPVQINAGRTYTVSYHTSGYGEKPHYFTSAKSNPPISVPANGGVYAYGSASRFPTEVWQSSNYFVDIVLTHQ
jgi:Domain of unknown function (DUF4082)